MIPSQWSSVQDWMRIVANAVNPLLGATGGSPTDVTAATVNVHSSSTNTLFVRPAFNIASGTVLYSSSPDFSTAKPLEIIASQLLIEPTEKIAVNPTANSLAQGFVVNQTTPTSGTTSGITALNAFYGTVRSALTTGGVPGSPSSGTWIGTQFSYNVGGPNYDADSFMALSVGTVQTVADTSYGDKNGLASGVSIQASTNGKAYAMSSGMTVTTTGACPVALGCETDLEIDTTSVSHAIGYNAWSGSSQHPTGVYSAFTLGASGGLGPAGLGVKGWKQGITFFTEGGATNTPVDPNFDFFYSDHSTTIRNFAALSNVAVTGNILDFPNVTLAGSGAMTLKAGAAASAIDFLSLTPSDYTAGKPKFRIGTNGSAANWVLGLWNGANNNGTLNISASTVAVGGLLSAILPLNHAGSGYGSRSFDTGPADSGGVGYRMVVVPN